MIYNYTVIIIINKVDIVLLNFLKDVKIILNEIFFEIFSA